MKRVIVFLFLLFLLFSSSAQSTAAPISSGQAESVVKNWLVANSKPMGSSLGGQVVSVTLFQDAASGSAGYYFIQLNPNGWVLVPADDSYEPILSFGDGKVTPQSFIDNTHVKSHNTRVN